LVHTFNVVLVFFEDNSAFQFQSRRQLTGLNAEGSFHDLVVLDLFVTRQRFVDLINLLLEQFFDLLMGDEVFVGRVRNAIVFAVTAQLLIIRNNQCANVFSRITDETSLIDEGLADNGQFDGMRRDVFAAGRDKQFFLAVGNEQESITVKLANVSRLKPSIVRECFFSSVR
jgi:hypothetical protein